MTTFLPPVAGLLAQPATKMVGRREPEDEQWSALHLMQVSASGPSAYLTTIWRRHNKFRTRHD